MSREIGDIESELLEIEGMIVDLEWQLGELMSAQASLEQELDEAEACEL